MSLDFTRGRRKGERKQRSNKRKLCGGSASKHAKRFGNLFYFWERIAENIATVRVSDLPVNNTIFLAFNELRTAHEGIFFR